MRTNEITTADVQRVIKEIEGELECALQTYPSPNANMTALAGELGELGNAMNKEPRANVRAEAIQVAVMAIRLILEGDPFIYGVSDLIEDMPATFDQQRIENFLEFAVKKFENSG